MVQKKVQKQKCHICGKSCGCYVPYKDCFLPRKEPRYIKYMVDDAKWAEDLKHFNVHLKRIFDAKCYVDSRLSKVDMDFYMQRDKLHQSHRRVYEIDRENKRILKRIIEINRKGGNTDNINKYALMNVSQWRKNQLKMFAIDNENRQVFKNICDSKAYYPRKYHVCEWRLFLKRMGLTAKFPPSIFKKTSLDEFLKSEPTISGDLDKWSIRPECFLEFQVEGGEYLGKIIVELYNDHLPVTVQNFLEIIKGYEGLSYENCPVHRIVKGRYLETGDITKGTGTGGFSIYGETFDEENHRLMHTKAGVLSMARVGRNQKNNSRFCITFMNMQELDKKNVVFGKVISGASVLMKINAYGREIGKPLRRIFISKCGEIPDYNCEEQNSFIQCVPKVN